ncbi:hypothetical protein D9M70_594790 [compost metagenome]
MTATNGLSARAATTTGVRNLSAASEVRLGVSLDATGSAVWTACGALLSTTPQYPASNAPNSSTAAKAMVIRLLIWHSLCRENYKPLRVGASSPGGRPATASSTICHPPCKSV